MIELSDMARREETRQAEGLAAIAPECVRPASGGTIARSEPGSWTNNAVGMGVCGAVAKKEVDALIEYHASKGIEPRIELCPFADEGFVRELADRGFVPRIFENVFFRELVAGEDVRAVVTLPGELVIEQVDPASDAAVREFAIVSTSGFAPPGYVVPESDLRVVARMVRDPRCVSVLARLGGVAVGGGTMAVHGDIAALFGLSVLEAYRRRGVQQALLAARLNIGITRGATLATIGSKPGIATERNVRRMGFQLGYTKVHLVRPGPGLVANVG
ncbi:MAG: GNAT family N-acetyltransferase [Phycisphaerales bacterium]|nr:GNAT family N-acetyltransferase [Phycisphaerales bacterium]